MSLINRLERIFGRFAIPNLALWLVAGQFMFLGFALLARFDISRILLVPAYVQEGEVWRLFTFVLVPPVGQLTMPGAVFLALAWYIFYLMGNALEGYWGTFRFNLYFWIGWALTVGVSFLTPLSVSSYEFLAVSVFLAFAFFNPDFEMLLFFILPVKIKWLALLTWVGFGYSFLVGDWSTRLSILAATGNYLLFFGRDIVQIVRRGRRRMEHQARQFAARDDAPEPRHTCRICGKTDLTHPQMDFRYCSKCAGDECYCPEHIFNHEHVTTEPGGK